ncbi:MAG: pyruvate dehydrogenase (acetyl-transferring), homodimeric type [Bermanella sp.]
MGITPALNNRQSLESTDYLEKEFEEQVEDQEWMEAIDYIIKEQGVARAGKLIEQLAARASKNSTPLPYAYVTAFRNTIPVNEERRMPGNLFMERRIRSLIRWNALAMVMRANAREGDLGGHISSFSSSATLYDVGFNYFFRAPNEEMQDNPLGDLIYYQGHISPGIYARSFLEGRLSEDQLNNFRQEVDGKGLSSYPHPWLMPDYWQFPTVSMGLGPIQAIYQAHIMNYLDKRELVKRKNRKVWAFLGDGETDEPETLGAISLAGREQLDNLLFVINCNLQRLDGPVRGNGKIIQELEGQFRGAGWNVIKVVWGRHWDPILAKDTKGLLQKRMDEVVDGEVQNYKVKGGAYTREHFFGTSPELLKLVEDLSDDEIYRLNRGGHDPYKVYAAYAAAAAHKDQPTVILAHTVKGYGIGSAGEAQNTTHSVKKLDTQSLRMFRDRFDIPLSDDEIEKVPFYRPAADSPEMKYMLEKRQNLGGFLPQRRAKGEVLKVPPLSAFDVILKGSGKREISTTMAFVRLLGLMTKDKNIGERVVPIIPDEARTFGMEGMFRQLGIYSSQGQKYTPMDSEQVMFYREDKKGRMLEEGINEAGAFSAWLAAATSYSTNNCTLIPFYTFYSMFGFQRVGDLSWAAGDAQARGFLIGATAGRTTLNGEGLQHQDGHSHILAGTIPNCICYDPAFGYEMAVVIQDGMSRMIEQQENVFYYITAMNENYVQPAMPENVEKDIISGMYLFKKGLKEGFKKGPKEGVIDREVENEDIAAENPEKLHVQLLGSGAILREVIAAAEILKYDFNISSDIWSVTSFNELRKEGLSVQRWNMLHPLEPAKQTYVESRLGNTQGPVIAATDYMKNYADQIREFLGDKCYRVLGTDGYGRSDTREKLRSFFEVDRYHVCVATLKALADEGKIESTVVAGAIKTFGINPDQLDPVQR